MSRCFVIQPFDEGGPYDRRYNESLVPAIEAAALEPYRVDRDPSVTVPIHQIEQGIRDADVCLAEISEDNPNVWFELGFAIASGRKVVLLCSRGREPPFPFDVQHRTIIRYETSSPSDFSTTATEITRRLRGILSSVQQLGQLASVTSISRVEGLEQYEVAGLVSVAGGLVEPEASIPAHSFQDSMVHAGFTSVAATLALAGLLRKNLLQRFDYKYRRGGGFVGFGLTLEGWQWLESNTEKLSLQRDIQNEIEITDDDISR